ncbi:hypothetical protein [Sphingopyxis sp. MSC1_008]|jgi:hypothetical protein|uniref:hypothetical protein n=1 Tax=Sphingopyxis sp. MSC1_008 TaxID=2909265 RepID=UPI0020C09E72|nr:hypothetical protein [Sphingopyxis sp. MSC1_008]
MRSLIPAAACAALLLALPTPTHGQGFLKRIADRIAEAPKQAAEETAPADKASEATAATAPAKPKTAASPKIAYPSQLPEPEGFAAAKKAYDDFGKVRCTSCEGGYAYDGWPVFPRDETPRPYNGSKHILGEFAIGHVHRWKGAEAQGSLTIVSEEPVGGFRCRQLLYRLTKGSASAERPGLLCWGYANQFAGSEGWNQVY